MYSTLLNIVQFLITVKVRVQPNMNIFSSCIMYYLFFNCDSHICFMETSSLDTLLNIFCALRKKKNKLIFNISMSKWCLFWVHCPFKFVGAELNSLYLAQSAVHTKQVCGSYILALFPLAGSASLTTWRSLKHRWANGIEVCCFSSLASPCRTDIESA